MALRPCLGTPGRRCSRLTDHPSSRCPGCRRTTDTATLRSKRQRRPRISRAEEQRRAAAVRAHRARCGDWCPGWGVPAHAAGDLTADHRVAVGAGGSEGGVLDVLCRACNGRKADHA